MRASFLHAWSPSKNVIGVFKRDLEKISNVSTTLLNCVVGYIMKHCPGLNSPALIFWGVGLGGLVGGRWGLVGWWVGVGWVVGGGWLGGGWVIFSGVFQLHLWDLKKLQIHNRTFYTVPKTS